jgi:hypothetical protein
MAAESGKGLSADGWLVGSRDVVGGPKPPRPAARQEMVGRRRCFRSADHDAATASCPAAPSLIGPRQDSCSFLCSPAGVTMASPTTSASAAYKKTAGTLTLDGAVLRWSPSAPAAPGVKQASAFSEALSKVLGTPRSSWPEAQLRSARADSVSSPARSAVCKQARDGQAQPQADVLPVVAADGRQGHHLQLYRPGNGPGGCRPAEEHPRDNCLAEPARQGRPAGGRAGRRQARHPASSAGGDGGVCSRAEPAASCRRILLLILIGSGGGAVVVKAGRRGRSAVCGGRCKGQGPQPEGGLGAAQAGARQEPAASRASL